MLRARPLASSSPRLAIAGDLGTLAFPTLRRQSTLPPRARHDQPAADSSDPLQRLRAITFDVVNRFSKTRRISRALAVTHPPVRHAYMAPPASIRLGAQTALVRCQVAQGPHPRVSFFARGGGGGVGMVLRSASARLDVRQRLASLICLISCFLRLLRTASTGRHRSPRELLLTEPHVISMRHVMPPCSA